jgi:hypothetical protein
MLTIFYLILKSLIRLLYYAFLRQNTVQGTINILYHFKTKREN